MDKLDTTGLAPIKSCFENIVRLSTDLSRYYQSIGVVMFAYASLDVMTQGAQEWCDSIGRILNGTPKAEINQENVQGWFSKMEEWPDNATTVLGMAMAMDPSDSMSPLVEQLAQELDKLATLVAAERKRLNF